MSTECCVLLQIRRSTNCRLTLHRQQASVLPGVGRTHRGHNGCVNVIPETVHVLTLCVLVQFIIFLNITKRTYQPKNAPIVIIDVLDSHFELTVYFTVLHNMLIGLQLMVLFYASLKLD